MQCLRDWWWWCDSWAHHPPGAERHRGPPGLNLVGGAQQVGDALCSNEQQAGAANSGHLDGVALGRWESGHKAGQ